MKPTQLKSLKVGDRVVFSLSTSPEPIPGEVTEVGCFGLRIQWSDGPISTFAFNDEPNPVLEAISLV